MGKNGCIKLFGHIDSLPAPIANARLTYTGADENWSLALFVRNLTDEDYRVYSIDASFAGFTGSIFNPPRWYGATATYNW